MKIYKKAVITGLFIWAIQSCVGVEISSKLVDKYKVKPEIICVIIEPVIGYANFFTDVQDGIEYALKEKGIEVHSMFYMNPSFDKGEKRIKDMIKLYKPNVLIEIAVAYDEIRNNNLAFDGVNGRQPNGITVELVLDIYMKSTATNSTFWNGSVTTSASPAFGSNPRNIRGKETARAIIRKMEEDKAL